MLNSYYPTKTKNINPMSLFSELTIRNTTFRNRIGVSPMCQYSSIDGIATDWHMAHLGARAVGGAGLVICEATAVEAIGRISPGDAGLWHDGHIEPLLRINRFIHSMGAKSGIQLAHAGRKASTCRPWEYHPRKAQGLGEMVSIEEGGWEVIAPSSIPFSGTYPTPRAMTIADIQSVIAHFKSATVRALAAEYDVLEIHAAHGYLAHSFLSPLSNKRDDTYGGSFDNRIRFLLELTQAVRETWPESHPLFVRISATDWVEGGWTLDESIELAKQLKQLGVDLIDCSSGGMVPDAKIPLQPGYQVPFASRIRQEANILTAAVGLITEATQANAIIEAGDADMVLLARELLRDPYWPLHNTKALQAESFPPLQYKFAF
jgi:2,4-dienoyl-CoA reductase-like NADH-dependent reductase (Old Yellow Enzyme family)